MQRSDVTYDGSFLLPDIVEQPCGLYVGPDVFSSDYDADDYREWVEQSNGDPVPAPLVLYIQDTSPVDRLEQVRAIEDELRAQGALFDSDRPLEQLIIAGSIAAEWSENQLYRLVAAVQASFLVNQYSFYRWCACIGNVIPNEERLRLLRILGFNHIRFTLTGTVQPEGLADTLADAIQQARQIGFEKIILDVQRLPADIALLNTLHSVVVAARPDRVRMPHSSPESIDTFDHALRDMGFSNIGLDWYLGENDSWWRSRKDRRLYWTMLGFSELPNPDVIGIGPGALSSVGDCYSLNEVSPSRYVAMLEEGKLPVVRGTELEPADLLRRELVTMILAAGCIPVSSLEEKWGIEFDRFFARENELLQPFERNQQVSRKAGHIDINVQAYHELVEICSIFRSSLSERPGAAARPSSSKPPSVSKSHIVS